MWIVGDPCWIVAIVAFHRQTKVSFTTILHIVTSLSYNMKLSQARWVFTDGDVALAAAVERCFPLAFHGLCTNHFIRSVKDYIQYKMKLGIIVSNQVVSDIKQILAQPTFESQVQCLRELSSAWNPKVREYFFQKKTHALINQISEEARRKHQVVLSNGQADTTYTQASESIHRKIDRRTEAMNERKSLIGLLNVSGDMLVDQDDWMMYLAQNKDRDFEFKPAYYQFLLNMMSKHKVLKLDLNCLIGPDGMIGSATWNEHDNRIDLKMLVLPDSVGGEDDIKEVENEEVFVNDSTTLREDNQFWQNRGEKFSEELMNIFKKKITLVQAQAAIWHAWRCAQAGVDTVVTKNET